MGGVAEMPDFKTWFEARTGRSLFGGPGDLVGQHLQLVLSEVASYTTEAVVKMHACHAIKDREGRDE